jgi:hypothetical protein
LLDKDIPANRLLARLSDSPAEAYGSAGERVEKSDALRPALRHALD